MDDRLKQAMATIRSGDTRKAQSQLVALLEDSPEQAQGWYLLSLIVDSPQKQAAYLSKTLALNPNHAKAREQLTSLQSSDRLASTGAVGPDTGAAMDVIAQSESDTLPAWLTEESARTAAPTQIDALEDMADDDESLPDWLKEPANIATEAPVDEPTAAAVAEQTAEEVEQAEVVEQAETIEQFEENDFVLAQEPVPAEPEKRKVKRPGPKRNSTRGLNIILGILIILAIVVILLLGYLLLS